MARAEGERRRARSAYFPQLNGSASYQRSLQSQFSAFDAGPDTHGTGADCLRPIRAPAGLPIDQRLDSLESAVECASAADPFASFGDLPFGRPNNYRFGLSFSQMLFSGGQVGGQAQAAGAGVRSAAIGLTSAQAQLLLDVTGAYYDATLADRLFTIAQATLDQADTTLSQTQLAREVGNLSEFDLLRARVTRDNQRPVVIQRRADRDLPYYRLKSLLDIPLDEPLMLTTELGDTSVVDRRRLRRWWRHRVIPRNVGSRAGAPGGGGGRGAARAASGGPGPAPPATVAYIAVRAARLSRRGLSLRRRDS